MTIVYTRDALKVTQPFEIRNSLLLCKGVKSLAHERVAFDARSLNVVQVAIIWNDCRLEGAQRVSAACITGGIESEAEMSPVDMNSPTSFAARGASAEL